VASLLELLVSRRIISADQAQEAAALAEETGAFIGRILVSQGAVEEQLLARFLADECTESLGIEQPLADAQLVRLLPERLMRNYRMVPLSRSPSGILRLAVAEPLSVGGIDQVKRRLGMPVRLVLVGADTIETLLDQTAPSPPEGRVQVHPPPSPPAGRDERAPSIPAPQPRAVQQPVDTRSRDAFALGSRTIGERTVVPCDWRPEPVSEAIPSALETAYETLRNLVGGGKKAFIALVGPDAARDRVLRTLCTTEAWDRVLYVDLVAHHCPDDLMTSGFSAAVFDGLDAASTDEEEERNLLRAISAAYAAHTPVILGMRRSPKDSGHLSRGTRLALGLARIITIEADEAPGPSTPQKDAHEVFRALIEETTAWSETAFAGAGLRPMMEAAARAYERGNTREAIGKATTSVVSRLSHLISERGR